MPIGVRRCHRSERAPIAIAVFIALFALIALSALINPSIPADTPEHDLQAFGIIGTWSGDCANTEADTGYVRTTFTALPAAPPSIVIRSKLANEAGVRRLELEVKAAQKTNNDKIAITFVTKNPMVSGQTAQSDEILLKRVYQKKGSEIRLIQESNADETYWSIKDGYVVMSAATDPSRLTSTLATPLLEKCTG